MPRYCRFQFRRRHFHFRHAISHFAIIRFRAFRDCIIAAIFAMLRFAIFLFHADCFAAAAAATIFSSLFLSLPLY